MISNYCYEQPILSLCGKIQFKFTTDLLKF